MTSVFQRRILRPLHCDENLRPCIPGRIILSDHLSVSGRPSGRSRPVPWPACRSWPTSPRCASAGPPRRLVEADDEDGDRRRGPRGRRRGRAAARARGRLEPRRRRRRLPRHRAADRLARRPRRGRPPRPWPRASRGTRSWPTASRTGRAGVECLSGIPGSVGATPIQNVGAYGQEVAETVVSVRAYDRDAGAVEELPAADCGFAYRSSVFKRTPGRWVVLAVTYALPHARPLGADPLRRARPRARRGRGRDGAARRRARGGARAAPREGHGHRPGRPGLRLGRLVLHEPGARRRMRSPRSRRARRSASGRTPACRASRSPTARSRRQPRG